MKARGFVEAKHLARASRPGQLFPFKNGTMFLENHSTHVTMAGGALRKRNDGKLELVHGWQDRGDGMRPYQDMRGVIQKYNSLIQRKN